jgi:hypothetical protein
MLAHYVADGHMPLHCDSRKFNDSIHSGMEEVWEHDVLTHYELEPVPGIINEKRFILDKQGLPIVKDTEKFQSSHLGKVVKTLENRDFIMGFGNRNNNVWDYMVDVCFFSYLLSTEILPLDIKNLEKFGFNEFKIKYMVEFENATGPILSDTIDSLARIWFHAWKEYRKMS